MAFHSSASGDSIHVTHKWTYADESARTGASGFDTDDLFKFALQSDENSIWMLVATTPTWVEISGHSAVDGLPTLYNSDSTLTGTRIVDLNGYDLTFESEVSGADLLLWAANGDSASYSQRSRILLSHDRIELSDAQATGGVESTEQSLVITPSGIVWTDALNIQGVLYAADYSANYVNRSLVDKEYVDAQIAAVETLYSGGGSWSAALHQVNLFSSAELDIEAFDTATSSTYTERMQFDITPDQLDLRFIQGTGSGGSSGQQGLQITDTAMTWIDTINSLGLVYDSDYSANFVDESLISKKYADDAILAGPTMYNTDGDLTGNRVIDIQAFSLTFEDDAAATAATGTLTFTAVPANGDITTIDGTQIHWVNTLNELNNRNEIARGSLSTATEAATVFQAFLNASPPGDLIQYIVDTEIAVTPSRTGAAVTVTADDAGTAGNAITTTVTGSYGSWGGATLSGGVDNFVLTLEDDLITNHQITVFEEGLRIPSEDDTSDYWLVDNNGSAGIRFSFWDDSASTLTDYFTIGGNAGNVTFFNNLILDQGNHLRLEAGSTSQDSWRMDGGSGSDDFRLRYQDSGTGVDILTIDYANLQATWDVDVTADSFDLHPYQVSLSSPASNGVVISLDDGSTVPSEVQLALNTIEVANATIYTLATNAITVLKAGKFQVSIGILVDTTNDAGGTRGRVEVYMKKNGTQVSHSIGATYFRDQTPGTGINVTFIEDVTANDVLTFWALMEAETSNDPPNTQQGETHVSMMQVGP